MTSAVLIVSGSDDLSQQCRPGIDALDRADVVVIEVDEPNTLPLGQRFVPGAAEEPFGVPVMRRPFGQDDFPRPDAAEVEDERLDEPRIGMDRPVRGDVDHVRLDDDALAPDIGWPRRSPSGPDGRRERFRAVVGAGEECHLKEGAGRRPLGRLQPSSRESGHGPGRECGRSEKTDNLPAGYALSGHPRLPETGLRMGASLRTRNARAVSKRLPRNPPSSVWRPASRPATPGA